MLNLTALRAKENMTTAELAEKVGLLAEYLQQVEDGQVTKIAPARLNRIAKALGWPGDPTWLLEKKATRKGATASKKKPSFKSEAGVQSAKKKSKCTPDKPVKKTKRKYTKKTKEVDA